MGIKVGIVILLILSVIYEGILVKLNDIATKKPLPENVLDVYNKEEYEKFINYRNDNKKVNTIKSLIIAIISILLLVTNAYAVVYSNLPGGVLAKTLLLMIIFEGISSVISIPFGYYDTFVIEEKYGMNKSTKKTFVADQIKSFLVGMIITSLLLMIAYILFSNFGNVGIVMAIGVIALLLILINSFTMQFMRIFNKFTPIEEGELKNGLMALCDKYNMQVKGISIMDASRRTTRANAFCAGIGNKKDIALDDNLVERYSTNQIVAVFAHEFAHAKYKHIVKQLFINILQLSVYVVIVGVLLNQPVLFSAFGFTDINYYFAIVLFPIVTWPVFILFGLLLNYFTRKYEYEADTFAAKEGYGDELISALKQLSKDSLCNLNPHPYIVAVEYSHPTLSQRIDNVEKIKKTV